MLYSLRAEAVAMLVFCANRHHQRLAQIKEMAARPGCRLEWIGDQVTWVGRVPRVAWLGSGQWHIGWGWLPTARTGRENVHDKIGTIPVYWDYYIDSFASY